MKKKSQQPARILSGTKSIAFKGTARKQDKSQNVSGVATAVIGNDTYLPAAYSAALAGIPNHPLRNRVQSILCNARMIAWGSDEDVAKQLAQPAKELHKIAVRAPAVRDAMVAIVEEAVKPLFLSILCLAARVVGKLITEDRLDLAQTARAVRGLVKIWLDIFDNRSKWMMDAELAAIFEQMGKDMVFALKHVAETMPELVIHACVRRCKQLPGLDVSVLCSAVGLLKEAARAGLLDQDSEAQLCEEEEAEEEDDDDCEEEAYEEEYEEAEEEDE